MSQNIIDLSENCVSVDNAAGSSSVILVCEHASHHIPDVFDGLGLLDTDQLSHAVWDPGAFSVAQKMSQHLDATLVSSRVSRLVYDCNRPPSAADAMPTLSEVIEVPGNKNLSVDEREARIETYYQPFFNQLQAIVQATSCPIIVTVHSFTPIYHGDQRSVEIGILHDSDTRLTDAMMRTAKAHTSANVQINQPYGPEHGVTHTLKEHAVKYGHMNVMLEIRNDLIKTPEQQKDIAAMLSKWIVDACGQTQIGEGAECRA
jgi:predicted N-formylglutamate amidohydrolase